MERGFEWVGLETGDHLGGYYSHPDAGWLIMYQNAQMWTTD